MLKDAVGRALPPALRRLDDRAGLRRARGRWPTRCPGGELDKLMQSLSKTGAVDLLAFVDPKDPKSRPSLAKGPVPAIVVATEPTELIVTQGEPNYSPIDGTQLLYASNTTGHVFKYLADQRTYVLVSRPLVPRRHRRGPLDVRARQGPAAGLREDPRREPEGEREGVGARHHRRPQEAVIANSLPETAAIKISDAKLPTPKYDGPPQLKPIEGTPLFYVVNSPIPVIQVSPTSYYALQNGVWFVAGLAAGALGGGDHRAPGHLLDPAELAPPLRHLRLRLPGHAPGGVRRLHAGLLQRLRVRRRRGLRHRVHVHLVGRHGLVRHARHLRLRHRARPTRRGPAGSWASASGSRSASRPPGGRWGCYPWWGPLPLQLRRAVGPYGAAAWGPGGWAATTGNVYSRWGDTTAVTRHSAGYNAWTGNAWSGGAGMSYNSRTGTVAAGQRGVVSNAYTGNYAYGARGAAVNPRTGQAVSAGRVTTGNVYSGQIRLGGLRPRRVGRRRPGRQRPLRHSRRHRLPQHGRRLAAEQRQRLGQRERVDAHPVAQQRAAGPLERPDARQQLQLGRRCPSRAAADTRGGGGRRR